MKTHLVNPMLGLAALVAGIVVWQPQQALANPPSPPLGVDGRLVELNPKIIPAPDEYPNRGMRVNKVFARTAAARLGLRRGDVLISVDSMRFTSMEGYRHALRCSSDRPSFIILERRSNQLVRRSVSFPHRRPDPDFCGAKPPNSYLMSIDLRSDMRE